MTTFSRKLDEALRRYASGVKVLYKGMNEANFRKFKAHHIPGFLAELSLATVYSQPTMTGAGRIYLVAVPVDLGLVTDRSDVVDDMCTWQDKPDLLSLRNEIWTAPGSGHGSYDAVYYGQPVRSWRLLQVFDSDSEWETYCNQLTDRGQIEMHQSQTRERDYSDSTGA
jgi:hypothetical protein